MIKRSRFLGFLFILVLIALVLLSLNAVGLGSWFGTRLGTALETPEQAQQADVIIVLGSDDHRLERGLELYQRGLASTIVVTGEIPTSSGQSPRLTDMARRVEQYFLAASYGVMPNRLVFLQSTSTYEDARAALDYMASRGLRSGLVVSDWFHGRRAMCSFQAISGGSAQFTFATATNPAPIRPDNWWHNPGGFELIATEFLKIANYRLFLGVPASGCWSGDPSLGLLIIYLVVAFVSSLILVYVVRRVSMQRRLLDIPNERSSHTLPTPRGGGVVIAGMTLLALVSWIFTWHKPTIDLPILVYILAGTMLAAAGLYDDWIREVPAPLRLTIQGIAAACVVMASFLLTDTVIGVADILTINGLLAAVLWIMWLVGFTNAFNFMDGIDGIAATSAVFAGLGWTVLLAVEGQMTLALLAALLAVTSLGFLCYNAPPARIFMGDVGSVFLGFSFAALPLLAYAALQNSRLAVTGLIFLAPFVTDTGYTLVRRLRNGENILKAHRTHVYQRLVIAGFSHTTITSYYGVLMMVCVVLGLAYYGSESIGTRIALVLVIAINVGHVFASEYLIGRIKTHRLKAEST